jgi:hypothetical protein
MGIQAVFLTQRQRTNLPESRKNSLLVRFLARVTPCIMLEVARPPSAAGPEHN